VALPLPLRLTRIIHQILEEICHIDISINKGWDQKPRVFYRKNQKGTVHRALTVATNSASQGHGVPCPKIIQSNTPASAARVA
jgi:hypothetical protein